MWEPVAVPFQNTQPLPILPTTDEICACTNVLRETCASKVVVLNDDIVVKYGGYVNEWEGQALVYLERHVPEVPAPRLYTMYYDSNDSKQLFLVMQRIPGVPLSAIWQSLKSRNSKEYSTQCEKPNVHGLDGGGVHDYLFYSEHGDQKFLGPFPDEPAFVAGLVGNYRAYVEHTNWPDYKARFYEKYLPHVLQGHRPTLTHGNIQRTNIMVVENTTRPDDQGGRSFDVVLVDWKHAGWFPDFWEFFCASYYAYGFD
ncbi:uncharacterized protein N7515_009572 [Penicillium bovifimosum]|uniref:Aminoglycoside phosphotransferase domain-containing protein n=1 Tax=Penicillium bovifimosum TaxID=126998 RepID=A0A9W9KUM6_9EURO|nr:uncharacterized protein N7515_009572 [Penicillium bovifimosum]KAJ5121611.1 hypothetical protein N7515_009572 [Penicillium bovifimosum]